MGFFDNQTSDPNQVYQGVLNNLTYGGEYNQLAQAYDQQTLASILPQILGTANAQLQASQQNSPQYAQLTQDLLNQYGPQLVQTGSQLGLQQQQAQAANNAAVASGSGGQAALQAAIASDQAANPQFYAMRSAEGQSLANLLGSIDLSGQLSGGEQQALQRSVAQQNTQTGTANTPSAVNTAANAMTFGNATYQRQEQAKSDLSSALGQATSFLPASQSGVGGMNAWGIATGGPSTTTNTTNSTLGLFSGPTNYSSLTDQSNQNNLSSILGGALSGGVGLQNTFQSLNSGQMTGAANLGQGLGMATSLLGGSKSSSGASGLGML